MLHAILRKCHWKWFHTLKTNQSLPGMPVVHHIAKPYVQHRNYGKRIKNIELLKGIITKKDTAQYQEFQYMLQQMPNFKNINPDDHSCVSRLRSKMAFHTDQINRFCEKKSDECEFSGRYKYHEEVENLVNQQIVAEFHAAYTYLTMACYFGRTNVGMIGTHKFYTAMSHEENEHALEMAKYQMLRGGTVVLGPINVTECTDGCTLKKSIEISLQKEKMVADKLIQIYQSAEKHGDLHAQDFIVTKFMGEQISSVRQLAQLLARVSKIGPSGMCQYLFDQEMGRSLAHTNAAN